MSSSAIFWPVIAQVLLVYVVYLIVSRRRVGAVRRGEVDAKIFLVPNEEPAQSATAIRNLSNQFELPILFLFGCFGLFLIGAADWVAILLAWAFVASRIVHAAVHLTTNRLSQRRPLFIVGFFINGALWLYFAVRLAFG